MTVEIGGQIFGISFDSIVETICLVPERIMPLGTDRAFVLRDRTVPLLDLCDYLGTRRVATSSSAANVVVASIMGELTGLQVDRVGTRMDVMLQPMEGLLSEMQGIAGTTLLGDGRILLVLDLEELLNDG
jgi:two-component system, chemotaxis family, sensor kinase CheA